MHTRANNAFYSDRCGGNTLETWPYVTKADLVLDQAKHPPYGTNTPFPLEQSSRIHQTSGTTTGVPLRWLDTPASWQWLLDCWDFVYERAGVITTDRLFFPFSFGPFLGFWAAFESATRSGLFSLPGGGMAGTARLRHLREHRINVVCCTPTYALHLAQIAREEQFDLPSAGVRLVIVAGEPGGQISTTRQQIESAWGARVIDHYGLTEVGPAGVEPFDHPGELHINGNEFIAEVIEPGGTDPVAPGEIGELVLTNLGRLGSPLVRYRTGDLVCPLPRETPSAFLRLKGGILGRTDDMIHLRGNNLYPSAVEAVIRRFPEVAEFRVWLSEKESLAALRVEVEPLPHIPTEQVSSLAERLGQVFRDELLFRADIRVVASGTLPRFEMKAKRFVRTGYGEVSS